MIIYQIVPKLHPEIDGLGDYALNLARELRAVFRIETIFLVAKPNWEGTDKLEGFTVVKVRDRTPMSINTILKKKESVNILLHYAGYGYQQRGCPTWLVNGLERWHSEDKANKLITFFHEVYAFGAPWRSSFWLSQLQKSLACQLMKMSDGIVTTNQLMLDKLSNLSRSKSEIIKFPVFSNVGEIATLTPLNKRRRRLVIFGHRNRRLQVYQQCKDQLNYVCKALEITEICDVGVPVGLHIQSGIDTKIIEMGILESSLISTLLSDSIASFLNFPPPQLLAKSTVFAAFSAHGLVSCMVSLSPMNFDGLVCGQHYWSAKQSHWNLSMASAQLIATNANSWYQSHKLAVQAAFFAKQFSALANGFRD